jgi:hypothetical protein
MVAKLAKLARGCDGLAGSTILTVRSSTGTANCERMTWGTHLFILVSGHESLPKGLVAVVEREQPNRGGGLRHGMTGRGGGLAMAASEEKL